MTRSELTSYFTIFTSYPQTTPKTTAWVDAMESVRVGTYKHVKQNNPVGFIELILVQWLAWCFSYIASLTYNILLLLLKSLHRIFKLLT